MPHQIKRCHWCLTDPLYIKYHDDEWGKETHDDKVLFEFLVLEAAQAGLSWLTILKKRENYRRLFADFDAEKVAQFTSENVEIILRDAGIIRNKMKIEAAIKNAQLFLIVRDKFGSFDKYLYSFMPNGKPLLNAFVSRRDIVATTLISNTIAKDMKIRGFKFFGSTICYAYMQATGMVNDHAIDCQFR